MKCCEGLNTIDFMMVMYFRGNLDKAQELFTMAVNLAKTEIEMAHLYSLLDAALAQARVTKALQHYHSQHRCIIHGLSYTSGQRIFLIFYVMNTIFVDF